MAHNSDFSGGEVSGQNSAGVDERREHAPVVTQTEAFEEFDRWMDDALAGLVARWIHTASPRAAQQRLWNRPFKIGRKAG